MDSIVRADIPKDTPFVLDLLSNYVFRFVDFDGSLLLPKKTQTGYHLPGEITLCDNRSIERLVDNIIPMLDLIGDQPKISSPPQPRDIFDGCCADSEYGSNMQAEGYKEIILGNLTRIRNLMKQELIRHNVKNFWVVDSFAIVGDAKLSDHEEVINHLAVISNEDGVHYSLLGYQTLTSEILAAVSDLVAGKIGQAKLRTKEGLLKPLKYFWRGFHSRNGSSSHGYKPTPFGRAVGRGNNKFHPYRRN